MLNDRLWNVNISVTAAVEESAFLISKDEAVDTIPNTLTFNIF